MPTKLESPVNSPASEFFPSLSADGLELYFSEGYPNVTSCEARSGGYGHTDLWVSTRASKDDLWGEPQNLGPVVNSENADDEPCISADGLELYFMSDRPGASNSDIFVTTRLTKDDPWGEPVKLSSNINSNQYEYTPFISPDGLLIFFSRGYSKAHVWVSKRASTKDPWGPAEFFSPVNSGTGVWHNSSGKS
jgi:Tol biopolymer transport system component